MPATRELYVDLNHAELEHFFRAEGLKSPYPTIRVRKGLPEMAACGHYDALMRRVVIEVGQTWLTSSRLTFVKQHFVKTLLHELRHAWQYDHWDKQRIVGDQRLPYNMREMEIDANRFANENVSKWMRLMKISTSQRSVLGRISQAERSL